MKTIYLHPLVNGDVAFVDDCDFELVSGYKWYLAKRRHTNYVVGRLLLPYGKGQRQPILMHRLILGFPESTDIDHWDHDGTHNWRSNLRVCSRKQNQGNRILTQRNTSGFKGVYQCCRKGDWVAQIVRSNKAYYLGRADTPEDAARIYDEAALKHFGEFALTNAAMGRLSV